MDSFVAVARKWGNSKGIVLPSKLSVEEGEEVIVNVQRTRGVAKVKDLFGKLRIRNKVDTEKSLREIDELLEPRE